MHQRQVFSPGASFRVGKVSAVHVSRIGLPRLAPPQVVLANGGDGPEPGDLGEGLEVLNRDQVLADVLQPGLVDDHQDFSEVAQEAEAVQGAQRVEHELLILEGVDLDPHAVLQVDDRQPLPADDHGVGGAEAVADADGLGEVHPLLDQQLAALGVRPHQLAVVLAVAEHRRVAVFLHQRSWANCCFTGRRQDERRVDVVLLGQHPRADGMGRGPLVGVAGRGVDEGALQRQEPAQCIQQWAPLGARRAWSVIVIPPARRSGSPELRQNDFEIAAKVSLLASSASTSPFHCSWSTVSCTLSSINWSMTVGESASNSHELSPNCSM